MNLIEHIGLLVLALSTRYRCRPDTEQRQQLRITEGPRRVVTQRFVAARNISEPLAASYAQTPRRNLSSPELVPEFKLLSLRSKIQHQV
ncbi:hypothetical protein F2P81_008210 [Scophthalmus maximus]|uniref:Uncharacterized protein n=1 Tax=Scophthalmus maximus TaxID=52904 RepID=A0A6A4T4B7_SCOMX|nr:hypothetical protein F2P81_008210 [Scophthalmus maximus]